MSGLNQYLACGLSLLIVVTSPAVSRAADFAPPKTYPVGISPSVVVIGDFNGDGKPDIAVANSGSANVSVLLGNGDGTFKAAVNSSAGPSPQALAIGDFNGDHELDLIVISPGDPTNGIQGVVNLLLGNGDGTFQLPVEIKAGQFPLSMAIADLNNDKKLDLIVGDQSDGSLSVLLGNGDGTFQSAKTISLGSTAEAGAIVSIVVADFNGDNKPDVASGDASGFDVLLGNGDGSFQAPSRVPDNDTDNRLLVGDFNNDQKLDLVVRSHHEVCFVGGVFCPFNWDLVTVYLGKGDGTFEEGMSVRGKNGIRVNIAPGDFNGDGKPDLAVKYSGGGANLIIFLSNGDGTFEAAVNSSTGPLPQALAVGDFNGDGLPDLAGPDDVDNSVTVLLNTSPTSGADLALILSPSSASATVGGGDLEYKATVFNEGPQDASGVVLTDNLPSGLKFVSAVPSQGTCTGTTTITCDLGVMTEPSTATVQFTVTPTAAGTFTDALEVMAAQQELSSGNNSASFTVTTVPPDFTLSPAAKNLAMKRGGQASEALSFGAQGGFSGTIALTCSVSGPSPMPSCSISPNSISPGNNTMLTVNAAALSASLTAPWFGQEGRLYATLLPLGIMGFIIATGFDKKRRRVWALCLLMTATILPAACGGGSGGPPPPQNFTVTVTASSGAIQHSTAIIVTVD
jgi:uncharacterized repeat protein (TIGR01451 family)